MDCRDGLISDYRFPEVREHQTIARHNSCEKSQGFVVNR